MRKRCFQTSWLAVMRWSEIWCHLTSFDVDIVFSYMSKAYKLHFSVKCCQSLVFLVLCSWPAQSIMRLSPWCIQTGCWLTCKTRGCHGSSKIGKYRSIRCLLKIKTGGFSTGNGRGFQIVLRIWLTNCYYILFNYYIIFLATTTFASSQVMC